MDERTFTGTRAAGRWVSAVVVCVLVAPAGAAAADQSVSVSNFQFNPDPVSIFVGDTVTWMNTGGTHNVHFAGDFFEYPGSPSADSWSGNYTFTAAGTFSYICDQHPLQMTGTVNVSAAPPPPPGTPPPGTPPPPGGTPGTPGGQPAPKKQATKITLRVSDATPRSGSRVRFYGRVTPAADGRKVRIQKRARGGSFKTVASATLRDAGSARSTFSKRLRVKADGVYRARFGSALSAKRKLDVSA
jgi:plastocyanin